MSVIGPAQSHYHEGSSQTGLGPDSSVATDLES